MGLCQATIAATVKAMRSHISAGSDTERSLAARSGISQPHVHNICAGHRLPSPAMADMLLLAMRTDPAAIAAAAVASLG